MTLEEALEKAAAELPENALIVVGAKGGGVCVRIWDWYGDQMPPHDFLSGKTFAEQVLIGLQWCKDTSPKEEQEE